MAKILIIEDEEMQRRLFRLVLTKAGHFVITACDGQEGMKHCHAEPFDLVLTDIVMPNQGGLDTIGQLRREFPGLKIIAMSGSQKDGPSWNSQATCCGAHHTLQKPFFATDLINSISAVLDGAPGTSEFSSCNG